MVRQTPCIYGANMKNRRLQNGQVGEIAAERWFLNNGWKMVRTQPPVTILCMVTPPMITLLKRFTFSPRLAAFGHMVIARMGKGGVPDYTGFAFKEGLSEAHYRACEVKEATGNSMPASRLDKEQRAFLSYLPGGCAWVGIFWTDTQKFEMFPFVEKGSYKRGM